MIESDAKNNTDVAENRNSRRSFQKLLKKEFENFYQYKKIHFFL